MPPPFRIESIQANVRTTSTTRAGLKGGKLAGVIVAVAIGFLIGLIKACYYNKKSNAEQDDQVATSVVVHKPGAENDQDNAEPKTTDSNTRKENQNASSDVAKFCTKCGNPVSGAAFCSACGQAVKR